MALSGTPAGSTGTFSLFSDTVWLKKTLTFDAFDWGGSCMRLDGEGSETLEAMMVTYRQNPRGGVERDGVRLDPPGEATITVMMKHKQGNRKKSELKKCLWIVDQRHNCKDRDAFNSWTEITRYCTCKANTRTISGTGFDPSDEDAMIGLPNTCLWVDDVYRVAGEELTF